MNKFLTSLLLACALCVGITACKTPTLQSGGAYAPTNSVSGVVAAPDIAFFTVDSGFKLAHQATTFVLEFEMDNRAVLWQMSPKIKQTLDGIRPQINAAILDYAKGREAYKANPTPAGLTTLQTILAKMQQLAATAQASVPQTKGF